MTWLDGLTFETVIVHVDNGPSVKGLKAAVHDDCIVLREAMVLEDTATMLNGDLVIPRERVLFMQRVSTGVVANGDA